MKAQTLPLPNLEDWCSLVGAAIILGVSRRTVERMIEDGRLTGYWPWGPGQRVGRAMLWRPQVETLADALKIVKGVTE